MQPIQFFRTLDDAAGARPAASIASDDFVVNLQAGVTLACAALGTAGAQRMPASFGSTPLADTLRLLPDCFTLMAKLDREQGETAPLPHADAHLLVQSTLAALLEMASWAQRLECESLEPVIMRTTVGVGYWAMRHNLPIEPVAAVAHALGVVANATTDKAQLHALAALNQGVLDYVTPDLGVDLERSNPERPFRILTINLAMTAIRSEDVAMMTYAFTKVRDNLPDEAASFFAELTLVAEKAGLPEATKAMLQSHHEALAKRH
jgi:hypothetical protein